MAKRKTKELPFWSIKFKRFRLSKGLEQQEMADLLDLSLGSIRGYEQGLRKPKQATMELMHEKLGLDVYETFFNSELEDFTCKK
jgi:transcriptional regulator with XRE-family HTH domain